MATYTWPNLPAFKPASFVWGVRDNDRAYSSAFDGSTQTASLPGARWTAVLNFGNQALNVRPQVEAFLAKCRRQHRIALWNMKRPHPRGDINLAGVTLAADAGAFATQITLQGCGAGKRLLAGDMLGLPGQLLMVADDAVADGAGVAVVGLTHMLRTAHASGSAVTLVRPTALFINQSPELSFPTTGRIYTPITLDLVEAYE